MPPDDPAAELVALPITIQTPAGPLSVKLTTTTGRVPITSVHPAAALLSDQMVSVAAQVVQARGEAISCRMGCGACCRQLVPVSPIEAFVLADAVQAMEPDRQARVRARFADARRAIQAAGMEQPLADVVAERAGREVIARYFALQIPCPFLEDESCGVYEVRPMICREVLVTSDPSHCQNADGSGVRRIPTLTELSRALRSLSAAAWPTAPTRLPLVDALDWAAQNDGLRDTVARGVDLFKGLLSAMARQQAR
jgi:Fe-S-cluster containining protein